MEKKTGISGILQLRFSGMKSLQQLLLFMLLGLVLAVLPGKVIAQPAIDLSGITYTGTVPDTTGEVWNSGLITTVCSGNYTIIYSLSGNGSPIFEYRVNSGTWTTLGASPASVAAGSPSTLELRLMVTNLLVGQTVTIDNILAYEPFNVSLVTGATTHDITCNGASDGAIEVIGRCGQAAPVSYTWDGPDPYTNTGAAISGLESGSYEVTVDNGIDAPVLLSHNIIEPSVLSYSYTVKNWSCAACDGSIRTIVSGGTTPYDVNVSGGAYNRTTAKPDTTFGGLCAATYAIIVTDANSCPTTRVDTTIVPDNTAPTCSSYPDDYFADIGAGSPPSGTLETLIDNSYAYIGGETSNDTVEFSVDASNHNNLQLQVGASQSNENDWQALDFLKISVNTGSGFQTFIIDYCRWEGNTAESPGAIPCIGNDVSTSTAWVNLTGAEGKLINVQIVFKSLAPHNYTIQNLRVRGNKLSSAINPASSGQPENCTDLSEPVTVTYTDGPIDWFCNTPGNYEFRFNRHWIIRDACGNERTDDQLISVGATPVITPPANRTFDFCWNLDRTISVPAVTENCGKPTFSWTLTDKLSGNPITAGNDSIFEYDFIQPVVSIDTTYTITWTAVDSAGFISAPVLQDVTIKRPMQITLVPLLPLSGHFCTDDQASFTISVTGGTGSYQDLLPGSSLLPMGTWDDPDHNGSGTYTTTNLNVSSPGISDVITVNYTDVNFGGVIGGCSTGDVNFPSGGQFTVHHKIATNPLGRD
jgi:hypothetical protein